MARSNILPLLIPKAGLVAERAARNWRCTTCSKAFSRKGDLTRHSQLHTGFKPHVCPYEECRKEFSQNSGLKTHMNVHTRVKPYSCGIDGCLAKFGDPSSCARHKKETHRVKFPYKCPAEGCISRIKRRSAFKKHLKLKHDLDPEEVDIDAMAKPFKTSTPRRKSVSTAHVLASPPYIIPSTMIEEQRSIVQSPAGEQFLSLKPDQIWYPFGAPSRAESFYSAPTMSAGNLSTRSSTETLVEYDDYTNHKLYYGEHSSGHQYGMNGIAVHDFHTPSSSPTPKPPASKGSQISRLDMVNNSAQEAYDRQRYNPLAASNNLSFHMDPRYGLFHEKELDYSFNPSHQWPRQQWGYP